jgi:pyruvate/2-oxoglutarate dehydrogenase complex dihydrolipoamide acyltransferase (E2) component
MYRKLTTRKKSMPEIMAHEIANDSSFVVVKIIAESGEAVRSGDLLFEVEASKTIIDVIADFDGTLTHNVSLGRQIRAGDVFYEITQQNECDGIDSRDDVCEKTATSVNEHTFQQVTVSPYTLKKSSRRKRSEINNLCALDHGKSTSTLSILISIPGRRYVAPPFIFKNGISDLLVYEAAKLVREYPDLNACYSGDDDYKIYGHVNFGWAFDNNKNLRVLTLKNADRLSLVELQDAVFNLMKVYETEEKIGLNLVTGSTITFTDLSRTEVNNFIPLINGKQSLILGVTNPRKDLFQVIAAYDHRVSEGLTVANFLSELKKRILSYYFDGDRIALISCSICEKSISEEISLGHRGFIKMTFPDGSDNNLCRNCFEGF